MQKIMNLEVKTEHTLIKEFIDKNNVLQTGKNIKFLDLDDCIDAHIKKFFRTDKGNFILNVAHIIISNLKKHLQTYHVITERMMQKYFDESYYKLNRRYFGQKLFDSLIITPIYPY